MKTVLYTHELQVGDVHNGRRIIRIEAPIHTGWYYLIVFSDGNASNSSAQSTWEIERTMEILKG